MTIRREYILSGFIALLWFLATMIVLWFWATPENFGLFSLLILSVLLLGLGVILPSTKQTE